MLCRVLPRGRAGCSLPDAVRIPHGGCVRRALSGLAGDVGRRCADAVCICGVCLCRGALSCGMRNAVFGEAAHWD